MFEWLLNPFNIFGWNTDPGIRYFEDDTPGRNAFRDQVNGAAFWCEFDRICQQIDNDLPQFGVVPTEVD